MEKSSHFPWNIKVIIGIFGYDFSHHKTNEIIKNTFISGFSIGAVFLAPKINYTDDGSVISIDKNSINIEIREFCKEKKIPVYRVHHNDSLKISTYVDNYNINIGLIGGAKIIHQDTIEIFKLGIINYHPGQIPETSGLDSLYRTIENIISPCVTAHLIDGRVDAGLFILESRVSVFKNDTLETISNRILEKQIDLNQVVLKGIEKQTFCFPEIDRPYKNKRLNNNKKEKIMTHFDNWKMKFSTDL
jgi:folate-dependent phosphoribosylglycinamide formyltransferase PurN